MAYDLKKESEVKEYVEKLGVEYRFGCYSEKKPEGNLVHSRNSSNNNNNRRSLEQKHCLL